MTISSYLDNGMRQGAQVHNCRISLSGTTITITAYDGAAFSAVDPLLVRISGISDIVVTSGSPTHDFGTASWGLPADDGYHAIFIGLQKLSATSAQIICALSREHGTITTLTNANTTHPYHVSAPSSQTGEVIWIATIHNVQRVGGAWSTSTANVEEDQS